MASPVGADANTLLQYLLNESGTPWVNSGTGGALNLTYDTYGGTGSNVAVVQGPFGNALWLGTKGLSSANTSVGEATNLATISAWFRLNSWEAWSKLFAKIYYNNQYASPYVSFGLATGDGTAGQMYAYACVGGVLKGIAGTGFQLGKWHHIAATFNGATAGGTLKVYRDGGLINSATSIGASLDYGTHGKVVIGHNGYGGESFRGIVCDCRMENVERSVSDLLAQYNAGPPGFTSFPGTVPATQKTWTINTNYAQYDQYAGYNVVTQLAYHTKRLWGALGYYVVSSSDGSTAVASDLWSSLSKADPCGATFAWVVLTCPKGQICIAKDQGGGVQRYSVYWSPAGAFAGGSTSAVPSAYDRISVGVMDYIGYPYGFVLHGVKATNAAMVFATCGNLAPQSPWCLGVEEFTPLSNDVPTGNYICHISAYGEGASTLYYPSKTGTVQNARLTDGRLVTWAALTNSSDYTENYQGCNDNNYNDGNLYCSHIGLVRRVTNQDTKGIFGYLIDRYWGPKVIQRWRNSFPSSGNRNWIQVVDVLVPWSGNAITWAQSGDPAEQRYDIYLAAPNAKDGVPPTVTIESPTPGTAIQPAATLQFTVTDATGLLRAFIWVSYPGTGYPSEWIHDGDNFNSIFAGSRREAIADGYRYYVTRAIGWPAGPTIVVRPIDVDGNEIS